MIDVLHDHVDEVSSFSDVVGGTVDPQYAAAGLLQATQSPGQRGLSGTISPDHRDDLTAWQRQLRNRKPPASPRDAFQRPEGQALPASPRLRPRRELPGVGGSEPQILQSLRGERAQLVGSEFPLDPAIPDVDEPVGKVNEVEDSVLRDDQGFPVVPPTLHHLGEIVDREQIEVRRRLV